MLHNRTTTNRAGFTLVELLVVIGVIALLISILMPALSQARRSAQNVKCLSNLRQLGVAMNMYVNENKDFLPLPYVPANSGPNPGFWTTEWQTRMQKYLGIAEGKLNSGTGYNEIKTNRGTVFNCPMAPDEPLNASYALNSALTYNKMKRGRIPRQTEIIFAGDCTTTGNSQLLYTADAYIWTVGWQNDAPKWPGKWPYQPPARAMNAAGMPGYRHGKPSFDAARPASTESIHAKGTANFVFLDGHAGGLSPQDLRFYPVNATSPEARHFHWFRPW